MFHGLSFQNDLCHPSVILFSLVALEKFSETSENKLTIQKRLEQIVTDENTNDKKIDDHPIRMLEQKWVGHEEDYLKRQVGFCSQWCLDNLCKTHTNTSPSLSLSLSLFCEFMFSFSDLVENRVFSYKVEPTSHINVMLNANDVSEYLKIAPNGLEVREQVLV